VVRVCGEKRYVFKVLIAGFETLGFFTSYLCLLRGIGGQESQLASRGCRGAGVTVKQLTYALPYRKR
jgi:hypothetical protein